jgi:hypothetical protein
MLKQFTVLFAFVGVSSVQAGTSYSVECTLTGGSPFYQDQKDPHFCDIPDPSGANAHATAGLLGEFGSSVFVRAIGWSISPAPPSSPI